MKNFVFGITIAGLLGAVIYFKSAKDESFGSAGREPASVQVNMDQQKAMDEITALVKGIRSKDDVAPVLQKVIQLAGDEKNKNFPGVQTYAAIAQILPEFEGFFYRMRGIVEKTDWLHIQALYDLRSFAYTDYMYGPHVKAIFNYLTEPVAQPKFAKPADLQDFLLNRIAPKLEQLTQLSALADNLPPEVFQVQMDRSIMVGEGEGLRFIDPSEQQKLFIKPYHYSMRFILERYLGAIYYLSALDLDEYTNVVGGVIRQTAINMVRPGDYAKGVTPMMVVDSIKRTNSFLTWRKSIMMSGQPVTAQQLLDKAYAHASLGARYERAAYVCGITVPLMMAYGRQFNANPGECAAFPNEAEAENYYVPRGKNFLLNPNHMLIGFRTKYHEVMERARVFQSADQNQPTTITSDVTGRSITVNVRALFKDTFVPRNAMATSFAFPDQASRQIKSLNGALAWNYDSGKPIAYSDYTFAGFLPQQSADMKDFSKTMATLVYTKSIAPFSVFIPMPSPVEFHPSIRSKLSLDIE